MLHESDTDDWCLAKRLRPYEYLSQCQCSMSNSFLPVRQGCSKGTVRSKEKGQTCQLLKIKTCF